MSFSIGYKRLQVPTVHRKYWFLSKCVAVTAAQPGVGAGTHGLALSYASGLGRRGQPGRPHARPRLSLEGPHAAA